MKLVIFDMDGVLVDSEPAITYASLEALAEAGVTAQYDDFKPFTGMGDDKFIQGVIEKYGGVYDMKLKERAYEIYIKRTDRVKVYPSSRRVIELLKERGILCAVASASDMVKVKTNLACIGIDTSAFSAVISGSDVKNKKPDPEIFLKAAATVGSLPRNCTVIEDAVSGVMAAKRAGMRAIAVTTSFSAAELYEAGADFVVNELYDVPEHI